MITEMKVACLGERVRSLKSTEQCVMIQITPHSKHTASLLQRQRVMMCINTKVAGLASRTKHVHTLCGHSAELCDDKVFGTRIIQE
jgi:hypothetical protein